MASSPGRAFLEDQGLVAGLTGPCPLTLCGGRTAQFGLVSRGCNRSCGVAVEHGGDSTEEFLVKATPQQIRRSNLKNYIPTVKSG